MAKLGSRFKPRLRNIDPKSEIGLLWVINVWFYLIIVYLLILTTFG